MILVPTIPHTGTHFMRDWLLEGLETRVEHIWPNSTIDLARLAEAHPTIVPLRHPRAVALSWKRRGKDLAELSGYWRRLVQHIDPTEPHYLPLDVPDRDRYLGKINEDLGLGLATDWEIQRGEETQRDVDLDPAEEDFVKLMMMPRREFFARFYE